MTLGCTRSQRRSQLQRSPCNLRVRMMGLGAKATNRKIAMKVTTLLILASGQQDSDSDTDGAVHDAHGSVEAGLIAIQGIPNITPFFLVESTRRQYWGKPKASDPFIGPYRPSWTDKSDGQEVQQKKQPSGCTANLAEAGDLSDSVVICRGLCLDNAGHLTGDSVAHLVQALIDNEPQELWSMIPAWAKAAASRQTD